MQFARRLLRHFTSGAGTRAGKRLLRGGRFAEAREAFAAGLATDPRDRKALTGLGYLALLRNDLAEAEERLQAARAIGQRDNQVIALLAEVYQRKDDFGRAAPLLREAGRAAAARKLESFGQRTPYRVASDSPVTEIPFEKIDPLPLVRLRANGTEGLFLLDTGGGELILDGDYARQVGAICFGAERSYYGAGMRKDLQHGRIDSVRLGAFEVSDVPVQVMDLGPVGPVLGQDRIDGIVGTVILYHFRSTIDYQGGRLVFDTRTADEAGAVAIPFWLADSHYVVARGQANGAAPMLFLVDTGLAGAGFTCPPSTMRAAQIHPRRDDATRGTGVGGSFDILPFTLAELRLGDVRRAHIDGITRAFPPQLEWDLGFHIGGLVSHQFFRPGALTLDFAAMQLIVSGHPNR
jgi:predicted aspartyl protease